VALFLALLLATLALLFVLLEGAARPAVPIALAAATAAVSIPASLAASVVPASIAAPVSSLAHRRSFRWFSSVP